MKNFFLILSVAFWACSGLGAEGVSENEPIKAKKIRPIYPITIYNVIDTPTAEILDYGSFTFSSRFMNQGGILPALQFGVFQRLMLGTSIELDNYIGHGTIDLQRPSLQFKFRFSDGGRNFPAAAVGYDSQGYRYDKAAKKYAETERGLYFVLSQEVLVRGFEASAGFNVSDFENDRIRFFTNASWIVAGGLGLFIEYDNIQNKKYNRLNAGGTVFLSPTIQMGFYIRDMSAGSAYKETALERHPERVVDIRYTTNF